LYIIRVIYSRSAQVPYYLLNIYKHPLYLREYVIFDILLLFNEKIYTYVVTDYIIVATKLVVSRSLLLSNVLQEHVWLHALCNGRELSINL
jgi:hypothetical protein